MLAQILVATTVGHLPPVVARRPCRNDRQLQDKLGYV